MEKKNTSVFYNGLIWGLILGFAIIIFNVILYMTGQFGNQALGWLVLLITVGILIMGLRSFRDQIRGGVMPFGPAFGFAVVAVLVSSLLASIYTYILVAVIDPGVIQIVKDAAIEKGMERSGGRATPEMIEEGMEMMSWMWKPFMFAIMGFFSGGFMGTIAAIILAAIFKKDEDPDAGLAEAVEVEDATAE